MLQSIKRRTLLRVGGSSFGLGLVGTSSAEHSETQLVESDLELNRLLPDLIIENNSSTDHTLQVIITRDEDTILDRTFQLDLKIQIDIGQVFEKTDQYPPENDYQLDAQLEDGDTISRDATIVAAFPEFYAMIVDFREENDVYVYDHHVDPPESDALVEL